MAELLVVEVAAEPVASALAEPLAAAPSGFAEPPAVGVLVVADAEVAADAEEEADADVGFADS